MSTQGSPILPSTSSTSTNSIIIPSQSSWPNGCYLRLPSPPVATPSNRSLSNDEILLFQLLISPLKRIVYEYAIPYIPPDVPIPSQWRFPIITRPPLPNATRRILKVMHLHTLQHNIVGHIHGDRSVGWGLFSFSLHRS
jgi:hypothetical protein